MPDFSTLSGGQAVLALLVVLLTTSVGIFGHWVGVRQAAGVEGSGNRDRSFEMLKWATDLACEGDPSKAAAGVAALRAIACDGTPDDLAQRVAGEVSSALAKSTSRSRSAA